MWDEDDQIFEGYSLKDLKKPEPVKYKKTGGRRKGKGGPGPVDKAVGNWLNWRSERRANRQRLIDEQEAQAKIRRQRNRNWLLRGSRDVTWVSPVIDSRTTKRVARRNLKSARERFANLSSEDKLNLHLQDISQNKKKIPNTLDKTSETPGDTTNRTPPELNLSGKLFENSNLAANQNQFTGKADFPTNSEGWVSKSEVSDEVKRRVEEGEGMTPPKPTDPKPTENKPWTEGKLGKYLALAAIIGSHGKPSQQMGIAKQFSKEDRSTPAYDPKASTKPEASSWNLASLNLEDDIYGWG